MSEIRDECLDTLELALGKIDAIENCAYDEYIKCRREHGKVYHVTVKRHNEWMAVCDCQKAVQTAISESINAFQRGKRNESKTSQETG